MTRTARLKSPTLAASIVMLAAFAMASAHASDPIIDETVVFAEKAGLVAVEAEHFFRQTADEVRTFHLTHAASTPEITPDGDPSHVAGASGGAYLEVLPDTRRTHGDKLIRGTNFAPEAGKMAVLSYNVDFQTPGKYYVWVRAYSTGSEDNGLHVGLDGTWPESGQRLQWCQGKNTWRWESKQRTEAEHCGEPHKIFLEIDEPGRHVIQFSMREDGFEFDKFLLTTDRNFQRPDDAGPVSIAINGTLPKPFAFVAAPNQSTEQVVAETVLQHSSPTRPSSDLPLQQPREKDGEGSVTVSGETKQWHKLTIDLNGPFAHEKDNSPNPFTDYRMTVSFVHSDGTRYQVPGYFAADGRAADSAAESGTVWRAHFAPDRTGQWNYEVSFQQGKESALDADAEMHPVQPYDKTKGSIQITRSDKSGRDLRGLGRLEYVGKRYLQFAGTKQYFLKTGADAPETLLAFADFDNTHAGNPKKAPLKTWSPHLKDWNPGDPTWRDGKGKGLIGAINYLSGKGCNAFSFLTYNAGGDGDNVWPFIARDDKMHYDCSKLDQWSIVFDHGTEKGMYLHFKMQETENDDHTKGKGINEVPESLDGGDLGPQRKLYCRELIARFGHNLALNWNLGEENTQTTEQQKAMIDYLAELDPYHHNIVVHTYPEQQDKVYRPLLGDQSKLTGVSLQNSSLETTHAQTFKWVSESENAGKPWVVAFDESGSAAHAQCPDLGYRGFDGHDRTGKMAYTQHKVRKQTLWGTLMAGGAGNEYYFGYQFDENDIVCEDWRSRDQSWNYCRIAIGFFHDNDIPFWEMKNVDELIGNPKREPTKYCFAKPDDVYLVYLGNGGTTNLDLTAAKGEFDVKWFNPREGGTLQTGDVTRVRAGREVALGNAPSDTDQDWLVVVSRR